MKKLLLVFTLFYASFLFAQSKIESTVVEEINLARTNPKEYVKILEERKKYYTGMYYKVPGAVPIKLVEGIKALNEAITFLNTVKPIPALSYSKGMSKASKDHLDDMYKNNLMGHVGSNGSTTSTRINKYGEWSMAAAENISYGETNGRDVVAALLIDDGVSTRGHRKNIFMPNMKVLGVAFGKHQKYGTACVIDFAGGYKEK